MQANKCLMCKVEGMAKQLAKFDFWRVIFFRMIRRNFYYFLWDFEASSGAILRTFF